MDRGNNNNRGGARGRGGGGRGGGGGGRGRGDQQGYQNQNPNQGGRGGPRGSPQGFGGNRPAGQTWGPRPVQPQGGAAYGGQPPASPGVTNPRPQSSPSPAVVGRGAWGTGSPMIRPVGVPARPEIAESSSSGGRGGGGRGAWGTGGRGGWGPPSSPSAVSPAPVQPQNTTPSPAGHVPDIIPDLQQLQISEKKSPVPSTPGGVLVPVRRPDNGGTLAQQRVRLLVNHFPVSFNKKTVVIHYDVDIKKNTPPGSRPAKIPKALLRMIKDKLFADESSQFPPVLRTAYDGEKNIFSAVVLPTGKFTVEFSEGEDARTSSYTINIQEVKRLEFAKIAKYLSGELLSIPQEVLQAMEVVMKENPTKQRIMVGRSFYPTWNRDEDHVQGGVTGSRGFNQSLKPTANGLSLCLDYTVLAFYKKLPVLDFLMESVNSIRVANDVKKFKGAAERALKGLKVTVTHRRTKQKYTITGLTDKDTAALWFDVEEGNEPPKKVSLVEYFKDKYKIDIVNKNIPCLNLGRGNRINYVPMEFCVLAEGQRYQKENLDKGRVGGAAILKEMSLVRPERRMQTINEMVQGQDGPCGGGVSENFGIQLLQDMTRVDGRVIAPPQLRIGPNFKPSVITVDMAKRQWNLVGKSVLDGRAVDRWVLLDFTAGERPQFRLRLEDFVNSLIRRCGNLGMKMADPVFTESINMEPFGDIDYLQDFLEWTVAEAGKRIKEKLQIVVCVMADKSEGYKYLKWLETKIGVVTQCCLVNQANKPNNDQFLANLALKINAKLGGSNAELAEELPCFKGEGHVMFIGADVNHPAAHNTTCPSIAAVVGSVNWPSATRYAARVCAQFHRKEKIVNFGEMCLDLIKTYEQLNKARPRRIVVFRDGVSEGQFDMVLNEELLDLKQTIYTESYRPTITVVVAQKRHQTRLFLEPTNKPRNDRDPGNVPPGTVVDKVVTHPFDFDFYLCSHHGGIGTSKPTHYYVLYDEHRLSSDQLQKLIYNMCFTFARCTKPVSLVPPVYYADLVAFRGRLFMDVLMEKDPQGAAAAAAASAAVLNQNLLKVHPDLKDVMFFV